MPSVQYRAELDACRERLRDVAARSGGADLEAMVDGAKLFRARLVYAAGEPLGAPPDALRPAALSIELLHLASLVHDDIIDDASERRGVAALHVAIGRDRALVVGDLLIVAAFDAIAPVAPACVEVLSAAARECCLGQLDELGARGDYRDVAARKTGALFAGAASLGARAAGADGDDLAAFGTALGVVYQIRDDVRDGEGDAAALSRSAVEDVGAALDRVPPACVDALRGLLEEAGLPGFQLA